MPGGKDVGANMRELNASSTKRPQKQKVAIALDEARRAGANIPRKRRRLGVSGSHPMHAVVGDTYRKSGG